MDKEHRAKRVACVGCAIVTVSDTRTAATDKSGRTIRDLLEQAAHNVVSYTIVADEPAQITAVVMEAANRSDTSIVLVTGGTGLSTRDTTYEAMDSLYGKRLDGFGGLFRMLSFREIGSSAMLSRASAGTVGNAIVFSMPGSTAAVSLAMERLIIPEISHVAALLAD